MKIIDIRKSGLIGQNEFQTFPVPEKVKVSEVGIKPAKPILRFCSGYGFWTCSQVYKICWIAYHHRCCNILPVAGNMLKIEISEQVVALEKLSNCHIFKASASQKIKPESSVLEQAVIPPSKLHFPVTEIKSSEALSFDKWKQDCILPLKEKGYIACKIKTDSGAVGPEQLMNILEVLSIFAADHLIFCNTGFWARLIREEDLFHLYRNLKNCFLVPEVNF